MIDCQVYILHACGLSLTTGCSNEFVRVKYDSATSTISCNFLNQFDTSEKVCRIHYGVCDEIIVETTSASDTSDSVTLKLRILNSASYCYSLTASNDSYTVTVEGQIGIMSHCVYICMQK